VAGQFTGPGTPLQNRAQVKPPAAPQIEAVAKPPTPPASGGVAAPAGEMEQFTTVALDAGTTAPLEEEDISGWDLDSEVAGMTEQQKEKFLKKLHQQEKDGSCIVGFSYCSWG